jgi:predicted GTPase
MNQIIAFFGSNYSLIERFFNLFNPFNPALGLPRRFLNISVLLGGLAIFLGTIRSGNEKYILISGSANNEANRQELYLDLFKLNYESINKKQLDNKYKDFTLIDHADLNLDNSDKVNKCNKIRNHLKMILLIENFNSEPNTFIKDIDTLYECFDIHELKEKLFFIFTYSSNKLNEITQTQLRKDFYNFNSLFKFLSVSDLEKKHFVEKKVWMLGTNRFELEDMKKEINIYLNENKNIIEESWIIIKDFFHSIFFPPRPKKKLVLIGQVGNGKSSTGNTLCGKLVFSIGNDINRVTTKIKNANCNNYIIFDCPGFGDPENETFFLTTFLERKTEFLQLTPIDAFILVIKFDKDKSSSFLDAVQQFMNAFGITGLKSLMILCIQSNDNINYSIDEFENIILNSDGYLHLLENNENKNVPYCPWDNLDKDKYGDQENCFTENLNKLSAFTSEEMKNAFFTIDNEIKNKQFNKPSQKAKKKLVLIGQVGNGKSSTGNTLCGKLVFSIGNDINRVTTKINIANCTDYIIFDCPGFGDPKNETFFLTTFLKRKTEFLQ